jgi:nicotinamide-nucleotide amidase
MIAAILSTGTELTRGELLNSNATWLAAELVQLGVEVTTIVTVDDDVERITDAFRRLSVTSDLVVCTGGLGPTTDDLTAESLARACNVELTMHEPSLQAIADRLKRFGRELTQSNAKQALLPRGCRALPNANGTAPGFAVRLNRAHVFCMPGVPSEMRPMFEQEIAPELAGAKKDPLVQIVLRTLGMAESSVNDALQDVAERYGVTLGYRVHFPELAVKIVARRGTPGEAQQAAEAASREVHGRLGTRVVYGQADDTLPEVLRRALLTRGHRMGLAESCTGGQASALVTSVPGASNVFSGAIVAYANEVKQAVLGVPTETLESHGAVSEATAIAMAEGVRRALRCDWGISITGIAGPGGETPEKPVGTVHFAATGPGLVRHQHRIIRSERSRVQRMAAYLALNWLRCLLEDPQAELP